MKIQSLIILILFTLVVFGMGMTGDRAVYGDELRYRVDSIKCGCCDILEKGDTVLKLKNCFGEPDYIDVGESPANPFKSSEMVVGPEFWYYKKDSWTYRIEINNGLISGIQEIPTE